MVRIDKQIGKNEKVNLIKYDQQPRKKVGHKIGRNLTIRKSQFSNLLSTNNAEVKTSCESLKKSQIFWS